MDKPTAPIEKLTDSGVTPLVPWSDRSGSWICVPLRRGAVLCQVCGLVRQITEGHGCKVPHG